MKKSIILFAVFSIFVLVKVNCYADENVIENSSVKIIIDNNSVEYKDTPIIINNRILLPLREVVNNLGIENNDIVWNDEDKSILIRASKYIYLKIGDNNVYENNVQSTIDTAPIIYKNKTYIPMRFIFESLDKKVSWDNFTNTAFVRDLEEYNKVKNLIDEINRNMNSVSRYKILDEIEMESNQLDEAKFTFYFNITSNLDIENKIAREIWKNEDNNCEVYIDNNDVYYNENNMGWEKYSTSDNTFKDIFEFKDISGSEVLYCGLKVDDLSEPDKIILDGPICLSGFTRIALDLNYWIPINNANIKVTINKTTKLLESINLKFINDTQFFEFRINSKYSDYNVNFEIIEPENLIDSCNTYTSRLLKNAILTYIAESGDEDLSKFFKDRNKTVENLIILLQQSNNIGGYEYGPYIEMMDDSPSVSDYLPDIGGWEITIEEEDCNVTVKQSSNNNLIIKK